MPMTSRCEAASGDVGAAVQLPPQQLRNCRPNNHRPVDHPLPENATMQKSPARQLPEHRNRWLLTATVLLLLFAAQAALGASPDQSVQLKTMAVEVMPCHANLISDSSFEQSDANGIPSGWAWTQGKTDATCAIDRTVSHSGRQSVRMTNGTPFGPNVYGMLWRTQPVKLPWGKPYTMSAWVKSDKPGGVGLIGGGDWQYRARAHVGGDKWRRIWTSFTAGARDRHFVLRLSTEYPTRGTWIDDVKLEEGTSPTFDPPGPGQSGKAILDADEQEMVVEGDGPFALRFSLINPRAMEGTVCVALSTGESLRQPIHLPAGAWHVSLAGEAVLPHDAPRTITLTLEEAGREIARTDAQLRFCSAGNALRRLDALGAEFPALKKALESIRARGQDISYPQIALTVLENFVGYAKEDTRHDQVQRALEQLRDLEPMAVRLRAELGEALAGRRQFAAVPRWTGTKRPTIKGSSFLAPVRMPGGSVVERPVFFNGYGHFAQVVADMEKWPRYGTNIVQIEFGPNGVFPRDGITSDAPMQNMLHTLDRAQKAGVAVCLLISPHYFPQWAMAKWPQLRRRREGFLQYCLHAPEGQELLRRFIAVAIKPLKDHPALQSICLSNEPTNEEEPCDEARKLWHGWLQKRHGSVATMNARWGSRYGSFGEAPLPDPFAARPAKPVWLDYVRFNQEFFADWHKMLADAVHQVAPSLPVHAKAMTWTMFNANAVHLGVDATLFGRLSDISGNDSASFHMFEGEFAQDWLPDAMGYTLQRSVLDAPVFNSENHVIIDRETHYIPADQVRCSLWQGAIYGQGATAIWVWERTFDPKSDLFGSIMHRPGCAEAVGRANCDLNRAALEVTALQQAPPQVLVVQSVTASVWDGDVYDDCLRKLFTAFSFTGLKPGFVTERQLEEGLVPAAPVLCLPAISHFSDAALMTLRRFKGRLVFVGNEDCLSRDEYGRARPHPSPLPEGKGTRSPLLRGEKITFGRGAASAEELWRQILAKLPGWNFRPAVEVRGANEKPIWGIEWRIAETAEGPVVNLCNYRRTPVSVTLARADKTRSLRDVLTGSPVAEPLSLQPLEVRLLRFERR